MTGETPRQLGARIFREHGKSGFGSPQWVMEVLEEAKRKVAEEVESGFYEAEMLARINRDSEPLDSTI